MRPELLRKREEPPGQTGQQWQLAARGKRQGQGWKVWRRQQRRWCTSRSSASHPCSLPLALLVLSPTDCQGWKSVWPSPPCSCSSGTQEVVGDDTEFRVPHGQVKLSLSHPCDHLGIKMKIMMTIVALTSTKPIMSPLLYSPHSCFSPL